MKSSTTKHDEEREQQSKDTIEFQSKRSRENSPLQTTYAFQSHLKPLPLPPLEATLDKFLKQTCPPILTAQEYMDTERSVHDFLVSGQAHKLHDLLKTKALHSNSYIETYWDASYLEYDAPTPINVNPVFVLEDDPTPSRSQLLPRVVSLVYSSLKFIRAVKTGTLPADKIKDVPLCMDQFKRMFGSARVGGDMKAADQIITCQDSTHVVVLCENQFYYFNALFPTTFDLAVTERELTKIFGQILDDAHMHGKKAPGVGVLTSEVRSKWRLIRKELQDLSINNQQVLEKIDQALMIVCLDPEFEPRSVSETCSNLLHGSESTRRNRWYDKLQLIVTKGGTAGVNFEHSAVDGHSVLRFASDVFTDTIIRFAQTIQLHANYASPLDTMDFRKGGGEDSSRRRPDCKPRKLEFDLNKSLWKHIHFAESRLADAVFQTHTSTMEFCGYGKVFLIQNGVSPDATAQLAMQTAFFRLYGECANTYESVLTKSFFHGRTEAGRSCTMEALKFMQGMHLDESDGGSAEERVKRLRTGAKAHSAMTGEASKGLGVDRMLFAMECMAKEQSWSDMPSIFSSPGWTKLNVNILSTSNCGNPSLRFFGFGPVSPQGFGIGYIIKEDSMHFMITSKGRQTDRFRDTLQIVLEEIHDDLLAVAPKFTVKTDELELFRCVVEEKSNHHSGGDGYDFFGLNQTAPSPEIGREF